jgi:ABC-2 type transport system permease protein
MNYVQLYWRFFVVFIKTKLEYRFGFFMEVIGHLLYYSILYLEIWVLFNKFHTINGWSYYEVMFLYNMNLFTYGLCGVILWAPMRQLESMVQTGTFDGLLVKPIPSFLHLIFRHINPAFFGHVILGGIVFAVCLGKLEIEWSVTKGILFIIVLAGAFLIQCGIMVLAGSVSFWIIKSTPVIDTMIYGFRSFINYPLSIYKVGIQILLTFIIPYAFINFYPSQLFLGKSDQTSFMPGLEYGAPIVGITVFALAMWFWKVSVNKYQSTGS